MVLFLLPVSAELLTDRALVDRRDRKLLVFSEKGEKIFETSVGVGRGGLIQKKSMEDCVTPCGKFSVDLILFHNPKFDCISKELRLKYSKDKDFSSYVSAEEGLSRLFENMNSLDFDGDGKPDRAYGAAYIGLNPCSFAHDKGAACATVVTGPKLSKFKNTVYWFSIALHGTPKEAANIGKAKSGGCIQVPEKELRRIVENGLLTIGSTVTIK